MFVDRSPTFDDVAERMGEDAVLAMTTGEDETDAERGDLERAIARDLVAIEARDAGVDASDEAEAPDDEEN